jgi:periodic tryptophan protein 2
VLYKKYGNLHSQDIIELCWTPDSRFILSTSLDMTMKMISLHKIPDFQPFTFTGNKKQILKAFFSQSGDRIFSIAENGTLLIWKWSDEVSEEAKRVIGFHEFKNQKRLKLGKKEGEY